MHVRRPPTGRAPSVRFMVKLHPEIYSRLSQAASSKHVSRSDIVRLLLSEHLPGAEA